MKLGVVKMCMESGKERRERKGRRKRGVREAKMDADLYLGIRST